MLKGLRKNNKKGFTLVELIVVLVILAILAALLIPALTGYIKKAKDKQITAETRQIVMATQTLLDEAYGLQKGNEAIEIKAGTDRGTDTSKLIIYHEDIEALSEIENLKIVDSDPTTDTNVQITLETGNSYKIATVIYHAHGLKCTYKAEDSSYTVE